MKQHPEGGWYKETWKANFQIPQASIGRSLLPGQGMRQPPYFLLHPGEVSSWHTVLSDELWLYHSGSPVKLTLGGKGDEPEAEQELILGMDLEQGQRPQVSFLVRVADGEPLGDEPALVTCIVAPGFHFDDFH